MTHLRHQDLMMTVMLIIIETKIAHQAKEYHSSQIMRSVDDETHQEQLICSILTEIYS